MKKKGYGITYLAITHGGQKRQRYYGILKCPKDSWKTKAEVKRSRAYNRLKRQGRDPRIKKW